MTTTVVTVLCSVGVGLAVLIVVLGRATAAAVPASATSGSTTDRVREGVRVISATLAAGFVGGLLGFGLSGRLMMRVLAATSPDARGRLTDADEVVGEVSGSGTVFLVLFVALFGAVFALVYQLLRGGLPRMSIGAGLVAAGIGGGLLARPSGLLDPDNRDFAILGPTWLAVVTCAAVVVLGSLTIAVLIDRWTATWPAPAWSPAGVGGLVPIVLCALPFAAIVVLVLLITQFVRPRLAERRARPPRRVGWLLPAAGAIGMVWITISSVQILA